MAWSQDEERMLLQIERHLIDEDPRLVARLESFNERVQRKEGGRRKRAAKNERQKRSAKRPRKSTIIIMFSWLLIVTLIAMLLVMVLRHDVAAFPL
jgi:Flp pilus assembly protein TadB